MSFSLRLSADHDGRRLDRTIRSIWPALPLSALMRALRKGEVRLDSVRVREPGARVSAGQELYVPWEPPGSAPQRQTGAAPRRTGLPVIWRGDGAMVINKPAGLLVQPDTKGGDSVITRVRNMVCAEGAESVPGFAPSAVHRLDRNTTGALIVALKGDWLRALEHVFKERLVKKRYLAVVSGRAPDEIEIDAPLLKDAEANTVTVSREGKSALTRCRRLTSLDGEPISLPNGMSLVSIELLTGRTHQARVHTAHIGCPIIGDRKYGDFEANRRHKNVKRPLLHAFELEFPDGLPAPLGGLAGRTFRADVPDDISALIGVK